MPSTSHGAPRSAARKPVVVNIPVPIMFDTTNAVALDTPSRRCRTGEPFSGVVGRALPFRDVAAGGSTDVEVDSTRVTLCLDPVAFGDPLLVATKHSPHLGQSSLSQVERRTGARLLGDSTAVGDDRFSRLTQPRDVLNDALKRNPNCAWDVARAVFFFTTHVHNDDRALLVQLLEPLEGDSQIRIRNR